MFSLIRVKGKKDLCGSNLASNKAVYPSIYYEVYDYSSQKMSKQCLEAETDGFCLQLLC